MRSCIGCRSVKEKKELLRYVLSPDNAVVLDYNRKLPGRGCYICPDALCLKKAIKQRAFQKTLKNSVDLSVEVKDLIQTISARAWEKIASFISFAIRSRQAVLGTLAAENDLKKGKIRLLLLRSNLSEEVAGKWRLRLQNKGIACKVIAEFQSLEAIIGHRKVIGIRDEGLAREILNEVERVEKIQSNV